MIWIILLLALGLRLIGINQSLWLDEADNVVAAVHYSFWDFMTKYPIGDFHPPGYFAILWIWGHLFGTSELMVRLPSILLGVGTVYLVFLIGKKIWNPKIGLLAALLLAVSPLHIYYSQEARMYSLSAFAVTFSFYWLTSLLESPKKKINFLMYILGVVLVLYSDYVVYLILPIQLILIFWLKRPVFKKVFLGLLLGFLTLLPWLLIFPAQLANGRQLAIDVPGWRAVVGGVGIKDVGLVWVKLLIGRISFDNKLVYASIVGSVTIAYGIIFYRLLRKKDQNIWLVVGWFGLPIILALIASFFVPILSYFRLLFIIPAFALLLAVGLEKFPKKWQFLVICLVLLINFVFSSIYLFNSKFQREDWKGMVGFLDSAATPSAIVLLENNDLPAPFVYYYRHQIDAQGGLINFPAKSADDVKNLNELLAQKTKVYLVDYLVDISDPGREVAKKLQETGFSQTKIDNFNGVGLVYEYSR